MTALALANNGITGYLFDGLSAEILLRVGLSALAGGLLGIERERHGRAAGLRTTLLVSMASCIAMIISDEFYRDSFTGAGAAGTWRPDPARLAAGVLAGMGFLGAGVIIRQSNHLIRGVTTAATLWFVTIIGLAFGAGAIGVGLVALACSILVLFLVPYFESFIKNDWYSDLGVSFASAECSADRIVQTLLPLGVKVKGIDIEEHLETGRCDATFHLRYKRRGVVAFSDTITGAVRALPGVIRISFQS